MLNRVDCITIPTGRSGARERRLGRRPVRLRNSVPLLLPLFAALALLAGCFPFYSSRPLPTSHRDRCRQNLAQGWCDASCGQRQPEICCAPKNVQPWALGVCTWTGCGGAVVFGACPTASEEEVKREGNAAAPPSRSMKGCAQYSTTREGPSPCS